MKTPFDEKREEESMKTVPTLLLFAVLLSSFLFHIVQFLVSYGLG